MNLLAYRYELSASGVDSVIVQPGPFGTALIERSPKPRDTQRLSEYGETAEIPGKLLANFDQFLRSGQDPNTDPQIVADAIVGLIRAPAGTRPLRTIAGIDYGLSALNEAAAPVQRGLLEALGLAALDPTATQQQVT